MNFSDKLKFIIKNERMTLDTFAKETGVAKGALNGYLYADKKMGLDNLKLIINHPKFAKYSTFLTNDNIHKYQDDDTLLMLANLLDDESRKEVEDFAKSLIKNKF